MQMTEDEILREYQQAKNPAEQITILAQLNACTEGEIIGILKAKGIDGRTIAGAQRKSRKKEKITTVTVSELTGKAPADFTSVRSLVRYLVEQRREIDIELAQITKELGEISAEIGQ